MNQGIFRGIHSGHLEEVGNLADFSMGMMGGLRSPDNAQRHGFASGEIIIVAASPQRFAAKTMGVLFW